MTDQIFVIWYDHKGIKGYVYKGDGTNDFVSNIKNATKFLTYEAATAAKPGHHRDMGGDGFKGRVIKLAKWEIAEMERN